MKQNINITNPYLNTKEVAQLLKVSPSTIVRWRQEGIGPRFSKLQSGRIIYQTERIFEFADEHFADTCNELLNLYPDIDYEECDHPLVDPMITEDETCYLPESEYPAGTL